jgi:polyisoprenoid-binding protein YceI
MRRSLVPLVLLAIAVAHTAVAEERVLTLEPESTSVSFTLGATMHTVHGTMAMARGDVRFAEVPGPATGEVVLDATSAETGNAKRDRKMHKEVLESATHPEIVLTVARIDGVLPSTGDGTLTLHGRLSLHGDEHKIALELQVAVAGGDVQATGAFRVPYVEWGLDDPSAFVLRVDKHVDVTIDARGRLAEVAAEEDGSVSAP